VNPIPEEILDFIDILTPNEVEAAELLGVDTLPDNYEKVFEHVKNFIGSHPCSMVITLGEKGCLYVTKDFWKLIRSLKVKKVVDTTAAGDAFNGALAASIAENKDILKCLQIANIAGAVCVTKIGAQESMPYASEVESILKKRIEGDIVQ
ncbi:MAG: ribokinase, partial [Thermotoga sp.]